MLHLKGELTEQLSKELSAKWLSSSPINSAKIYTSSEAECVPPGFIFTHTRPSFGATGACSESGNSFPHLQNAPRNLKCQVSLHKHHNYLARKLRTAQFLGSFKFCLNSPHQLCNFSSCDQSPAQLEAHAVFCLFIMRFTLYLNFENKSYAYGHRSPEIKLITIEK